MELQFQINLRRMALLAYALSFWNSKEMKNKLKQFHYPYGRRGKMKYLKQLIDEVIEKIDPASLPGDMYSELIKVISDVAFKKYDWFRFIRRRKIFRDQSRRQIYDKFCNDIHWTHYGTVDGVKTLKHSWSEILNVDVTKVYIMACLFCSEDNINDAWDKINEKKEFYKNLCGWFGFHLAAYWFKLKENKLEDLMSDIIIPFVGQGYELYDPNKSITVNMLRWSVNKGLICPVKYFWKKLTDEEKKENLEWCEIRALGLYDGLYEEKQFYRKDELAEIIFLFTNLLDENLLKSIIQRKAQVEYEDGKYGYLRLIMKLSIELWPWQGFFKSLFSRFEHIINEKMFVFLLDESVDHSNYKNGFHQVLIHQLWNRISVTSKISFLKDKIGKLFEIWDLKSIKLMINDEMLITDRDDILKELQWELISLIRGNEISKLDEFIDKILIHQNWPENIKKIAKSLYESFLKCDVDSAVELHLGLSKEDLDNLKCKIDPEIMCHYYVIKNKFDEADKFLNWKFKNVENVKKFKKGFETNNFVNNQIHKLWEVSKENVGLAKENSNRFLLWLLRKEKRVIAFKVAQILPRIFKAPNDVHFDILEDFLKWYFLNDEGIQGFKNSVFKERIDGIFLKFVKEGRFEEINRLCKSAFSSDEELCDYMRKKLLSEKGILCCKLFISKYSCVNKMFDPEPTKKEMIIKFKNFIKWLQTLNIFEVLKEKLNDWVETSRRMFEVIGSDSASTEEMYSDCTDYEDDGSWTYCDVENYNLFSNLLNEAQN